MSLDIQFEVCPFCGEVAAEGHRCDPRVVLAHAAKLCDALALRGQPSNKNADSPRAAYQSGAATCAWQLRQRAAGKRA